MQIQAMIVALAITAGSAGLASAMPVQSGFDARPAAAIEQAAYRGNTYVVRQHRRPAAPRPVPVRPVEPVPYAAEVPRAAFAPRLGYDYTPHRLEYYDVQGATYQNF